MQCRADADYCLAVDQRNERAVDVGLRRALLHIARRSRVAFEGEGINRKSIRGRTGEKYMVGGMIDVDEIAVRIGERYIDILRARAFSAGIDREKAGLLRACLLRGAVG